MKCYEHFLNNIIRAHIISCDDLSMIIHYFLSISHSDTGIYTRLNSENRGINDLLHEAMQYQI